MILIKWLNNEMIELLYFEFIFIILFFQNILLIFKM